MKGRQEGDDPEQAISANELQQKLESIDLMTDWRGKPADKKKTGTWKAARFINTLNIGDTLATFGIGLNLVQYLSINLHQTTSAASNITTNFFGTTYLLPLFWGFIADSYMGRFWTIIMTSVIFIVGLALLTFAAWEPHLQPPACISTLDTACPPAGSRIITPIMIALYVIALGSGGLKPNMGALGADQFDDFEPTEKKQGQRFFLWYFGGMQVGILLATTLAVYLQNTSMGLGYGFIMGFGAICCVIFLFGTKKYRNKPPGGSPLTRMAQVIVAAFRKWDVAVPEDAAELFEVSGSRMSAVKGSRKIPHSDCLRFLDRAAVINGELADKNTPISPRAMNFSPWRLCSVTQVEEVKRILGMIPIWGPTCIVYIAYAQLSGFTIAQGYTMDRSIGPNFKVPPVSIQAVFMVFALAFWIPAYDKYLVPLVRKITKNPRGITPLQRIGTGMFIVLLAYIVVARVETRRLVYVRELGFQNAAVGTFTVPMSIFWMAPVYMLLGAVEVFTTVGQLDFFYDESSDGTRSLGTSFFYTSISMGYFVSTILVNAVEAYTKGHSGGSWLGGRLNNGGLEKFYYLLAGIMGLDFLVFLLLSHIYKYKNTYSELDNSPVGHDS